MKSKTFLQLTVFAFFLIFISACAKQEIVSTRTSTSSIEDSKAKIPQCNAGYHWSYYLSKCVPDCPSGQHNDSITGACVVDGGSNWRTPSVQTSTASSTAKNTLISTFNNLQSNGVNLQELSRELGLSYTIKADSINFANTQLVYDANNSAAKAVVANFKSNSNSNTLGYAFVIYTDGSSYLKPTIIKSIKNQYLKYFDLTEGIITTATSYATSSAAFSSTYGNFVSPPSAKRASCGQSSMNCFADAYTGHGWASLWLSVQTAFIPQTAVAIAGGCVLRNCFNVY